MNSASIFTKVYKIYVHHNIQLQVNNNSNSHNYSNFNNKINNYNNKINNKNYNSLVHHLQIF